jgi:glutathione-independent formaldehyde dehydrogenase
MKAVVYKGAKQVSVEDVEDPRIESPTDAIVRITTAGICGSDLHMYEGRTSVATGTVLGHENLGVVEEVGSGVTGISEGDRVVLPFNVSCGTCFNCSRGMTHACLTANPDAASAAYGYAGMGPFRGGQAERLRVPFADANCIKLPGDPGDKLEDDFLLLSDVFPTGYHATELAGVVPGTTVAIFGAGPVGLLAAYSAMIRGAAEVYVIDDIPERLKKAETIGAIAIDFTKGDPVEQIKDLRMRNPLITGAMRPGEEKMSGVMCGIDAVGYQAHVIENPAEENPTSVLDHLARIVNPTGKIGLIGAYLEQTPGSPDEQMRHGRFMLSMGMIWEKGIQIGMGQTPARQYSLFLRDLIIAGRAKPSFIVSHRPTLTAAPEAYDKFDRKAEGYTKVILKPQVGAPVP